MNSEHHKVAYSEQFIRNSKWTAYVLIAILVGLMQLIGEMMEEDTTVMGNTVEMTKLLKEFFVIVPALMVIFPILGWIFNRVWVWWEKTAMFRRWKHPYVIFSVLFVIISSLALLGLATPTFFMDDADDVWVVLMSSVVFVFIVVAIELFWILLKNRRELEVQNEQLLRNEEMSKYQALMNQMNPHFLFNSLNVLSYLVYKDPKKAEQFIEELSQMYRYILQLNEAYLVPLKKEVEFIDSYMFLQKIRHPSHLTFETDISDESFQKYIPPLTLETLVENAIKHNIIDAETPLHIKLSSQNGHLIVENNIQPRNETEVQSNHIGLQNLTEKFQILKTELPEFYVKDGQFVARIPLVKKI